MRTTDDTIALIRAGRYEAVWTPDRPLSGAPLLIGEALAFVTADDALVAYTPDGALLWDTLPLGGRLASLTTTADRLAIGTRPLTETATPTFHLLDGSGQMLYQVAPVNPPLAAVGPRGDTYLLDGATLYHIGADFVPVVLTHLPDTPGGSTALSADAAGNVYVFLGLDEGELLAYGPAGDLRWTAVLPGAHPQAPLLAAGRGCLLYALGVDGTLFAIDAASGELIGSDPTVRRGHQRASQRARAGGAGRAGRRGLGPLWRGFPDRCHGGRLRASRASLPRPAPPGKVARQRRFKYRARMTRIHAAG